MAVDSDFSRQRLFRPAQEIDILQLLADAQYRWLKPIEVCEILRNHQKFTISSDAADKPLSGSIFLYDRKALRYFRKDGHKWRKKKDGKTVKEAHERLKAGSIDVLHCYYAHGEDNPNFQRRSYWLLEEPLEHIVLVHYREVTEGNRIGFGKAAFGSSSGNSMCDTSHEISEHHIATSPSEGLSLSLNQDNEETESGEEFDNICRTEFSQRVPVLPKKDTDSDILRISHSDDLEESMSSNLSLFRPSRSTSSTVIFSGNSCLNPYEQPVSNTENRKIDAECFDGNLEALENMDFSELLQTPATQKLASSDTLDSATWKEILDGANDLVDGKYSDWNDMLSQVTPVTEDAIRATRVNSTINDQMSCVATRCARQLPQDFLEVISPSSLCREQDTVLETDLRAATARNFLNKPASENSQHNELSNWRSVLKRDDKVDQIQPRLLNEKKTYSHDVKGCLPFTKLEKNKQQLQNFQKQDSFDTWIVNELDPLLGEKSMSQSLWQLPISNQMQSVDDSRLSTLDNNIGPSLSQNQVFSIIDFSPEWAYCSSETKIIVTGIFLDSTKRQFDYEWGCVFGEIEVPAEALQQGVLRCRAPPHAPGNVSFYVTCNNRIACNEAKTFEYRDIPADRFPVYERKEHDQCEEEMLLQIRFARILSMHEDVFSIVADSRKRDLIQGANKQDWLQLEAMIRARKCPCDGVKEMFLQVLLKQELQRWLSLKAEEGGKGVLFVDEHGQGVLHLAGALGYEWGIAPILAAGVGVNFRDVHGWTALHWAAYCGREIVVVALLAADAAAGALTDPTPSYPAGRTAADLAASRGHGGIAGYLAEASLTSHLSSLKLNAVSASLNDNKAVETVSERNIVPASPGVTEDQLSLKDTLAAVRNASQAAARIQSAFRAHSFRRRQHSFQKEVDEFGLLPKEACIIAPKKMSQRTTGGYHEQMHFAATQIQCKYRGWKGRKNFLSLREHIVKIQAHVRGHQVRKKYKKLIWTVGILDKAILRWRRKGQGLRGFRSENPESSLEGNNSDDEEFLKDFRRQKEEGFEEELSRVQVMMQSLEARQQYRRMLENFQKAKGVQNVGDHVFDDEFMNVLG